MDSDSDIDSDISSDIDYDEEGYQLMWHDNDTNLEDNIDTSPDNNKDTTATTNNNTTTTTRPNWFYYRFDEFVIEDDDNTLNYGVNILMRAEHVDYDHNNTRDNNLLKKFLYEKLHNEITSNNNNSNNNRKLDEINIILAKSTELLYTIISYFIQNYNYIHNYTFTKCSLLSFILSDNFRDLGNNIRIDNNNDDNNEIVSSSNRTIRLIKSTVLSDLNVYLIRLLHNSNYDTNDDGTDANVNDEIRVKMAITRCSFFTSWYIDSHDEDDDGICILNALANNKYLKSLHVVSHALQRNFYVINGIIGILTTTTTLSKLALYNFHIHFLNNVSNLADAILNLETITDLSICNCSFNNLETLQRFHMVLENKPNIRKLTIDSKMFLAPIINNPRVHFKASMFSNLLKSNVESSNNNNDYLRELNIEFPRCDRTETSQEILSFFSLLKDSHIEKLIISFEPEQQFNNYLCKRLFLGTITYMSQLCYLKCCFDNVVPMSRSLETTYITSIGKCNRNLLKVDTTEGWEGQLHERINIIERGFEKYMKRNHELKSIIENKATFTSSTMPKICFIAKVTGPDTIYQLLRNM